MRKPMRRLKKSSNIEKHGGLAQLGERTLHRGDVAGSSPVASTLKHRSLVSETGVF